MNKNSSDIKKRAYYLSLETIKFAEDLPKTITYKIIASQLIRSVTSIGANLVESKYSPSNKDFINFKTYALKSANETLYWLCIIRDLDKIDREKISNLINETEEIIKIIFTIIKKLKEKDN